ncbi:MAG: hypothetical protein KC469_13915 [Flavobacteriaceae bacterium]|nr:hypothetical protein [Flavobacteriaceae bacterium]
MKRLNILLGLIFTAVILLSCEKDDICAEATSTTPKLVIEFYDIIDPDIPKAVSRLLVYGLSENGEITPLQDETVSNKTTVSVPLQTNLDETRIVLHRDFEIDDNGTPDNPDDDIVLGNPEELRILYTREDIYVSRACGYKMIFNDLGLTSIQDGDNWIINSEIINSTVENELSVHVKIFH